MKARILVVLLIGMMVLAVVVNSVQAKSHTEPFSTVVDVFSALNSGQVDSAVIAFAENATAENLVRGKTYSGLAEIGQMLQEMNTHGRQYEIIGYQQTGNTIIARLEVSDRGMTWGTETILVEVKDHKVQTFDVTGFRLELWKLYK